MSSYQCTSDSVEKDEAFKAMLDEVRGGLTAPMLEAFKYQCLDHIGRGAMEKITSFNELFLVLEQRNVLSAENVDFLILSLEAISRQELMNVVLRYKAEWLGTEPAPMKAYDASLEETKVTKQTENTSSASYAASPSKVQCDALPFATAGYAHEGGVVAPSPLNPTHEALISFVANLLSADWQMTARCMGVSDDLISAAQYNWPHDLRKQIYETFAEYSRIGGLVSREVFVEALSVTGRNDLAEQLDALQI